MADKLIVQFLRDWLLDTGNLRQKVLHKETTEMKQYGLDQIQIDELRTFVLAKIGKRITKELGVDLRDLREAIYGVTDDTSAVSAAAYDEGVTHIRRVQPAAIPINTKKTVTLMGQGFKSTPGLVTVEFVTGPPGSAVTVPGTVLAISSDIDVWQRVDVDVTLTQAGDWVIRAHNDDEATTGPGGGPKWSIPTGTIHAF